MPRGGQRQSFAGIRIECCIFGHNKRSILWNGAFIMSDDRQNGAAGHGRRFWEYLLSFLLTAALAALITAQVWLYQGRIQPVDSWYGADYKIDDVRSVSAFINEPYGVITWELMEYSRLEQAQIWQNGYLAASFNQPEVTVRVYGGDALVFDATAYQRPVRIRLKKFSAGINDAFLLQDIEACGERIELGRVVFK